ncbi:hypothetical protein EHS25_009788 [Saitozyma podzolica]|uniref:Apple domain-containing protein n=1 Tax=Saitozyma podzolica TaxID=1890683 RepID=A0A427YKA7_9TREE|nr:hypothetical protein EHS25_009788 [Saitozyma podzolica]
MLVRLTVLACLALVSAQTVEDVVRERQTNRDIIVGQLEAHKTRPRRSTASDLPNIDHCDYQPATTGTVFSNVDSVSIVGSWGTDKGIVASLNVCALNCWNDETCIESAYDYDSGHCYFSYSSFVTVSTGPGGASIFIPGTCADNAANFNDGESLCCNYYIPVPQ